MQTTIDQLAGKINSLQKQINLYTAKIADINKQIKEKEAELAYQKETLGQSIKTMYLEGDISTIEMLASSNNLSDFLDKQEYRNAVQAKISTTVQTITTLRNQLKDQKDRVQKLLGQKKDAQDGLASQKAEKDHLLSLNESQQAKINAQIQANYGKIVNLRNAQQAALAAAGGGGASFGSVGAFEFRNLSGDSWCGGGYHYCGATWDSWVDDTWGLHLARECVHYAADRAARGIDLSGYLAGRGNAEQWPSSLGGHYRVDHSPEVGAVAVVAWSGGSGHAMYVESVQSGGWVHVSQMNWRVNGMYSTMDVKSSGVLFVHFR